MSLGLAQFLLAYVLIRWWLTLLPDPSRSMIEQSHGGHTMSRPAKKHVPKQRPKIIRKTALDVGKDAWAAGFTPEELLQLINQHGVNPTVAATAYKECQEQFVTTAKLLKLPLKGEKTNVRTFRVAKPKNGPEAA